MGIINSVLVIFYYIGLYICIEIRASLAAAKTGNISVVLILVRFFFCAPRCILAHLKRWGYLRRMFMYAIFFGVVSCGSVVGRSHIFDDDARNSDQINDRFD